MTLLSFTAANAAVSALLSLAAASPASQATRHAGACSYNAATDSLITLALPFLNLTIIHASLYVLTARTPGDAT